MISMAISLTVSINIVILALFYLPNEFSFEMRLISWSLSFSAKSWTPRENLALHQTPMLLVSLFLFHDLRVSFTGRPSWLQEAAGGQTAGCGEQFAERPPVHRQWTSAVGHIGLRRYVMNYTEIVPFCFLICN